MGWISQKGIIIIGVETGGGGHNSSTRFSFVLFYFIHIIYVLKIGAETLIGVAPPPLQYGSDVTYAPRHTCCSATPSALGKGRLPAFADLPINMSELGFILNRTLNNYGVIFFQYFINVLLIANTITKRGFLDVSVLHLFAWQNISYPWPRLFPFVPPLEIISFLGERIIAFSELLSH